jgi:hypothetical protein
MFASKMNPMLSLSHNQLQIVMDAARAVPHEKRGLFLQRIAAMLALRGRFSDANVSDVVKLVTCGLVQTADVA